LAECNKNLWLPIVRSGSQDWMRRTAAGDEAKLDKKELFWAPGVNLIKHSFFLSCKSAIGKP